MAAPAHSRLRQTHSRLRKPAIRTLIVARCLRLRWRVEARASLRPAGRRERHLPQRSRVRVARARAMSCAEPFRRRCDLAPSRLAAVSLRCAPRRRTGAIVPREPRCPMHLACCVLHIARYRLDGRADARRGRSRLRHRPAAHLPPREGSPLSRAPRHYHCACTDAHLLLCSRRRRATRAACSQSIGKHDSLGGALRSSADTRIGREAHTAYVDATHTCHTTNTQRTPADTTNVQTCGAPVSPQ